MNSKILKKLKILIVCGGWSNEREISLLSGKNIFQCLKSNHFNVEIFYLNRSNVENIFKKKPDLIFNALHGEFGEDGFLSNLAQKNNILITHSDDLTSALCFNKRLLKEFLKKKLKVKSPIEITESKGIKFPVISKPNRGGSSNGIKLINNQAIFKNTLNNKQLLIEEAIIGKELTVTVLEMNKKIVPLAVTEIEFTNFIYDYKAKYVEGESVHHLPSRISKNQYNYLLDLSVKIYKQCNCQSIARLDFILSDLDNKFYFLELNTHPGLTKISLAPEQANYRNLSYLDLLESIIISSL